MREWLVGEINAYCALNVFILKLIPLQKHLITLMGRSPGEFV